MPLGAMLGQGGEGAVYDILNDPQRVVKVYHRSLTADRANKIRAMISLGNPALASVTAWPVELLNNAAGEPVGIVIPKVSGRKDIHHVYSPKSRRSDFPRADWRFLIRVALNTAKAFSAIHQAGCVIGDVNHGGILVGQDATIRLIDCDSFQVSANGRQFLCEVGVETFTPPELQGRSFAGVVRTPNHDVFGFAVLTFLLLFMGRHPFAGRYFGNGDMPIAQAIKEVRFPYGAGNKLIQMEPPPGTPPLSIAGPDISSMFERAFSRSNIASGRPTSVEWIAGLDRLEKSLKQCGTNTAHWHHAASGCPWCRMEGVTGVALFGIVLQGDGGAFDLAALWKQLEAIPAPGPAPQINKPATVAGPAAIQVQRSKRKRNITAAIVFFALIFVSIAAASPLILIGALAALWLISVAMYPTDDVQRIKDRHNEARKAWELASSQWDERTGSSQFETIKHQLRATRADYEALPRLRLEKLDKLTREQRRLQMESYLDSHEISDAKIEGVGPGRKQSLESFGIETALDVTQNAIARVPGFGPKTQQKLLAWRRSVEARFVFNPHKPIDPAQIQKVEAEILKMRKDLEKKLTAGAAELKAAAARINTSRQHMRAGVENAWREFAQAEADHKSI